MGDYECIFMPELMILSENDAETLKLCSELEDLMQLKACIPTLRIPIF